MEGKKNDLGLWVRVQNGEDSVAVRRVSVEKCGLTKLRAQILNHKHEGEGRETRQIKTR